MMTLQAPRNGLLVVDHVTVEYDDAFDDLYASAYKVAYRILGVREDAKDAASETLAKAWLSWSSVAPFAAAWVSRVSANSALSVIRRRNLKRTLTFSKDVAAYDGTDRQDLVKALNRLPKRQREVVVLRYFADLSEADTAALLGCSTGTVKQHATRGLQALRINPELAGGN